MSKEGNSAFLTFGEVIKRARKGKFSQKEVAAEIGVWDTYVGQIEKGDKVPSDEVCVKLAEALDLDTKKLLLLAYEKRASGYARELFERVARIIDDPVTEYLLSEDRVIDEELLEILKDRRIREALKDPVWREVFVRGYEMQGKDIPALIRAVAQMDEKQWQALANMIDVLVPRE